MTPFVFFNAIKAFFVCLFLPFPQQAQTALVHLTQTFHLKTPASCSSLGPEAPGHLPLFHTGPPRLTAFYV